MVPLGIIGIRESDTFHGSDNQYIANHRHDRCRRCRCQAQYTHLFGRSGREAYGSFLGQLTLRVGSDYDKRHILYQSPCQLYQLQQLACFPRIRDKEHHVVRTDNAQIAMLRLAGMQEECRRPCRTERRCDIHRNLSCFPHSTRDQLPTLLVNVLYNQGDSLRIIFCYRNPANGFGLLLDNRSYLFRHHNRKSK